MTSPAVLVTGANRRIGLALARDALSEGRTVVAHARHWNAGRADVWDDGAPELWSWDFEQPLPALPDSPVADLVLSASLFERGTAWRDPRCDVDAEARRLARHLRVNVEAPWELAVRLAHAGALQSVVLVLDTYFDRPLPGHAAYQVSRAAGAGLMRALAAELAPVRVNAVAPGTVLWSDRCPNERAETGAEQAQRALLGAAGSVEDVVEAVRYLRTARYTTGEILRVDGGRWRA